MKIADGFSNDELDESKGRLISPWIPEFESASCRNGTFSLGCQSSNLLRHPNRHKVDLLLVPVGDLRVEQMEAIPGFSELRAKPVSGSPSNA